MIQNNKIGYIFPTIENDILEIQPKENFFSRLFKKNKITKKNKKYNFFDEKLEEFHKKIKHLTFQKTLFFNLNDTSFFESFFSNIENEIIDKWYVFPLFFQFSEATTSKIANFFLENLNEKTLNKLFWIKSISSHTKYISFLQKKIISLLRTNHLDEKDCVFIFFTNTFDELSLHCNLFNLEINTTFQKVIKKFPYAFCEINFFDDIEKSLKNLDDTINKTKKRKNYIFIPLNIFDEVRLKNNLSLIFEKLQKNNKNYFLLSNIFTEKEFLLDIFEIINEKNFVTNQMLSNNI
ncbi:MAG: Ferrochelatase [Candidatus Anoxychlamydiales bacterium]|nr:Ferrochelatase [Candidatus Anoxychlamydiales bacterium]